MAEKMKLLVLLMMMLDKDMCQICWQKWWTRQWLLRREEKGACYTISKELTVEDTPDFLEH